MLTPHEIALLFVATTDALQYVDIEDSDVASLVARDLIGIEPTSGGCRRPVLTQLGERTVARLRMSGPLSGEDADRGL